MIDQKLSKACSIEDAIRYLRIPDDAAPYVVQCANIDPEFPRRIVFAQIHVVPIQLAYFLIERGLGHLLEDGPGQYLLDNTEDPEDHTHAADEEQENDEDAEEPDSDEDPPRRRSTRRRR